MCLGLGLLNNMCLGLLNMFRSSICLGLCVYLNNICLGLLNLCLGLLNEYMTRSSQ